MHISSTCSMPRIEKGQLQALNLRISLMQTSVCFRPCPVMCLQTHRQALATWHKMLYTATSRSLLQQCCTARLMSATHPKQRRESSAQLSVHAPLTCAAASQQYCQQV
jgi:hypothetical protein